MLTGRLRDDSVRISGRRTKTTTKTTVQPSLEIGSTVHMLPTIRLRPEYEYYDILYGKPIHGTYHSGIVHDIEFFLQSNEKNVEKIICEKYPVDIYKSR
jgi:hypothetical protein